MIRLVGVEEVEAAVEDLPIGSVVIVCDTDGDKAAQFANRVVGFRTAIFVGDLRLDVDREAACAFASETFNKDGAVIVGPH